MNTEIACLMIHSFFASVRARQMTAATVCGVLLLTSEGCAKTAIVRLPTITGDPAVNKFLDVVRQELRSALKEQEDAARELLAMAKTEPRLTVIEGGKHG